MAMVTTSIVTSTSSASVTTTSSITVSLTPATIAQPTPAMSGSITLPAANTAISSSSAISSSTSTVSSPKSSINKGTPSSTPERHSVQSSSEGTQVLNKQRLQDLVREVDPNEQLDDDVEELLLQIADDFIENVVTTSCLVAKHRKANTLEVKDVQLSLEKNWNMWIPGFGSEELRPYKKSSTTEAHKQRMALIRKALKKY